jgi:hypothetical protein
MIGYGAGKKRKNHVLYAPYVNLKISININMY